MARNLSKEERTNLINLYISGLTYRELHEKTGYSQSTIATWCKGIRSISESVKKARQTGKYILTEDGRQKLSDAAKSRLQKSRKIWTKPEQELDFLMS